MASFAALETGLTVLTVKECMSLASLGEATSGASETNTGMDGAGEHSSRTALCSQCNHRCVQDRGEGAGCCTILPDTCWDGAFRSVDSSAGQHSETDATQKPGSV